MIHSEISTEKLVELLTKGIEAYYSSDPDSAELTNEEFDEGMEILRSREPDHPLLTKVGNSESQYREAKPHHGNIGSLDKVQLTWLRENALPISHTILSLKADGASLVLYYSKGKFSHALLRGDGSSGNDVTDNVVKMDFPKSIDPRILSVRCEAVLAYEDFESHFNNEGNIRNKAAGLLNSFYSSDEDLQQMTIVALTINSTDDNTPLQDYTYQLELLRDQGFLTIKHSEVVTDHSHALELMSSSFNILSKENCVLSNGKTIPTDGVVVQPVIMDVDLSTKGIAAYLSSGAFAVKFPQESKKSVITAIHIQKSWHGRLIPVLEFEPIQFEGSVVRRATVNNFSWVRDLGLGIGAEVLIQMANGVIPNFVKCVTPVKPELPCGTYEGYNIIWDGVHLMLEDYLNPNLTYIRLLSAKAEKGFGWSGQVAVIEQLQPESIIDMIDKMKQCQDSTFVESLDLKPSVKNHLVLAAKAFFVAKFDLGDIIHFAAIRAVGDACGIELKKRVKVHEFITECSNDIFSDSVLTCMSTGTARIFLNKYSHIVKSLVTSLKDQLIDFTERKIEVRGTYEVTGTLSVPRDQLVAEFKEAGYMHVGVGKADFLIADKPSSSSKYKTAVSRQIPIMTESEFRERFLKG